MNRKLRNRIIEIAESLYNPEFAQRHYTFLVRRNKILSIGLNDKKRTHPAAVGEGWRFPNLHSEKRCILNFPLPIGEIRGCKLVNLRLNRRRQLMLSKPCGGCITLLKLVGPKSVLYSTNNGGFAELFL